MKTMNKNNLRKKVENLKVEEKLKKTFKIIYSFTIAIVIAAVVGLLGTLMNVSKLYNVPFNIATESVEICSDINSLATLLNTSVVYEDYDLFKESIEKVENDINNSIKIIEPIYNGDESILNNLKISIAETIKSADRVKEFLKKNEYSKAKDEITASFFKNYGDSVEKAILMKEDSSSNARMFTIIAEAVVLLCVIGLIVLLSFTLLIGKKMTKEIISSIMHPLNALKESMNELASGNLQSSIPDEILESVDEFGETARLFKKTTESLKQYISLISKSLQEIENKNLNVDNNDEYKGDFLEIGQSIENIITFLNTTFTEIKLTSSEVNGGARQVESASVNLSNGVANQLSSIQQVTASIEEINTQVQESAKNSNETKEVTKNLVIAIEDSNKKMQEMLNAMEEIKDSSGKINNIIETIDGIAEQTNLLALNAAIESARAGEVGRGFAVVADEIRQLADETSVAVKKTAELIGRSISAVDAGKDLAEETAKSLKNVVVYVEDADSYVNNIAESSKEQANAIKEINSEIEQISEVIEATSEIAEESAVASEDLTSQAEILNSMISEFKLK